MKTLLLSITAAVAIVATMHYMNNSSSTRLLSASDSDATRHAWTVWKMEHGRSYGVSTEEEFRFNTFAKHLSTINAHNKTNAAYTMGLNQFSDMTVEEFRKQYLNLKAEDTKERPVTDLVSSSAVPASKDWTETAGIVHPVKNQGQCGSCWAFGATAAHESAQALYHKKLVTLSEQQLVDCDTSRDQGCSGGLPTEAFKYLIKNAQQHDSDYPYTAKDGKCQYDASKPRAYMKAFHNVKNTVDGLKSAIAQQPVTVGVYAETWMHYKGGIYDSWWKCNFMTRIDHAVFAVGYGTNFFKIKNSWGPTWGEAGYIRVSTYAPTAMNYPVCRTTQMASYPEIDQTKPF